jgi:hypothetical protein
MTESSGTGVEALLREDIIPLAAGTFVTVFTGVGLGRERARNQVDKELARRFGKPRGSDDYHAIRAVIHQMVLVWEQARVASRIPPGPLLLPPDGARLLAASNPVDELRALLQR